MKFWRSVGGIFCKDLLSESRRREYFNSLFFFSLLVLFLFSFALGARPDLLREVAPGLLWMVILFSATLALERSFYAELEAGCLEGLRLYAAAGPRALFLGKWCGNFFFIALVQWLVTLAMFFLFDLQAEITLRLAAVFLLGDAGLATLGTFYAILTAKSRARQVLLPLLLFPMLVPLLLGAVHATEYALYGDPFGQAKTWIQLMAVFDWIFFVACFMGSAPLLEA